MWYTKFPTMNGPATDHFRRSDEWKRNPPFFVPTATTTLPFLIVRAMSPTCDRIVGRMKSLWTAIENSCVVRDAEGLIRPRRSRGPMDTQDILDLSLALAKQSDIPADTTINVPAKDVRRALFGVDVDAADLVIAKETGYDLVTAHSTTGGSAVLEFPKVLTKHADILTRHGVPAEVAA